MSTLAPTDTDPTTAPALFTVDDGVKVEAVSVAPTHQTILNWIANIRTQLAAWWDGGTITPAGPVTINAQLHCTADVNALGLIAQADGLQAPSAIIGGTTQPAAGVLQATALLTAPACTCGNGTFTNLSATNAACTTLNAGALSASTIIGKRIGADVIAPDADHTYALISTDHVTIPSSNTAGHTYTVDATGAVAGMSIEFESLDGVHTCVIAGWGPGGASTASVDEIPASNHRRRIRLTLLGGTVTETGHTFDL